MSNIIITRVQPYSKDWLIENIDLYDVNRIIQRIEYPSVENTIDFIVNDVPEANNVIDTLLLNMDPNFLTANELYTSKPLRNFVASVSNGNIRQTFTTAPVTINFSEIARMDTLYSMDSGILTVDVDGWYEINYNLNIENLSSNSRTSVVGQLEYNSGDGWVIISGSKSQGYSRNAANGDFNLNIPNVYVRLDSGTQVRVVAYRSAGGGTLRTFEGESTAIIKLGEFVK
jgi:hypothetical protein